MGWKCRGWKKKVRVRDRSDQKVRVGVEIRICQNNNNIDYSIPF